MSTVFRWQELAQRIQFLEKQSGHSISTDEDIEAFEQENNITFPEDYKEFCKIFGTGIANNWLMILCPGSFALSQYQEGIGITIYEIQESPSGNPECDQQKINVLENAFVFADDLGCGHFFIWDLRTYRNEDKCYDIYWAVWDAPESKILEDDLKFIGRSFFEIVQDFCYGTRNRELYETDEDIPIEYVYQQFSL
ncbi:MAG TPA: SMI1/KNR4 family protein [Thermosynechococcaceae cyanobacterium]